MTQSIDGGSHNQGKDMSTFRAIARDWRLHLTVVVIAVISQLIGTRDIPIARRNFATAIAICVRIGHLTNPNVVASLLYLFVRLMSKEHHHHRHRDHAVHC